MEDKFSLHSLKVFHEMNEGILRKLNELEAKEIDKTLSNLMRIEETFSDIEKKLDNTINKMIISKVTKDTNQDLNFVN